MLYSEVYRREHFFTSLISIGRSSVADFSTTSIPFSLSLPQAIALAKEEGVKIYTIGAGSDNEVFFGGLFSIPVDKGLDEKSLKALAKETQGNYFRAKDVNSLVQIYDRIDKLEPRAVDGRYVQEVKELYPVPAAEALLLFVLWLIVSRKVK